MFKTTYLEVDKAGLTELLSLAGRETAGDMGLERRAPPPGPGPLVEEEAGVVGCRRTPAAEDGAADGAEAMAPL